MRSFVCIFGKKLVCITSVGVLDEDMFRRLAATTVIDAMDSRGRNKVQFDDFGKPALACVMRAYGFELISGASPVFSGMKRTIGFSRQDMPPKQQHGLCWLMCCVIDSDPQIGSIIQIS